MNTAEDLFTSADLIHAYTRADALADGMLVDVCDPARRVGIVHHAAITEGLYEALGGDDDPGTTERVERTLRACLDTYKAAWRTCPVEDRVWFGTVDARGEALDVWANFGPADEPGVPVLTVMLTTED